MVINIYLSIFILINVIFMIGKIIFLNYINYFKLIIL